MMRAIDADALIEELGNSHFPGAPYVDAGISIAIGKVCDAPTIEERKWIPCSERLPENGHYYLWCSDMGHVQSDYYWNGFENGMKYGYNIVAWMPLPEPYREEGEADETN